LKVSFFISLLFLFILPPPFEEEIKCKDTKRIGREEKGFVTF